MKRLTLAAVGVAIALSAGAQTTDEKQQPAQPEGKAKVKQNTKVDQEKTSTSQGERVNSRSNER